MKLNTKFVKFLELNSIDLSNWVIELDDLSMANKSRNTNAMLFCSKKTSMRRLRLQLMKSDNAIEDVACF